MISVDDEGRVVAFDEKPKHPTPIPGESGLTLASMGNYIFNTEFLFEQLLKDAENPDSNSDFGGDIIPSIIKSHKVYASPFRDPNTNGRPYWRDVGTLDSYWEANMELVSPKPAFNLYDASWPIWTYQSQLPPAKFLFDDDDRRGMAVDSTVSGGCIVSGAKLRKSLLFSNVRVDSYTDIEESILLPGVTVGEHCKIRKAIIDRGCHVPDGSEIGVDHEQDKAKGYRVTAKGVVLVTRGMLGQPEGFA